MYDFKMYKSLLSSNTCKKLHVVRKGSVKIDKLQNWNCYMIREDITRSTRSRTLFSGENWLQLLIKFLLSGRYPSSQQSIFININVQVHRWKWETELTIWLTNDNFLEAKAKLNSLWNFWWKLFWFCYRYSINCVLALKTESGRRWKMNL